VKTKKMKNEMLDINKYVLLKDVDEYLKNGWEYGYIPRKNKIKSKKMSNESLNINKYTPLEDVDYYLKNG